MVKKTLLVTGASGFIGKNLKELLKDKYNLLCPTHSEIEFTDEKQVNEYFKTNKIDVVLHMANLGGEREKAIGIKDVVKTNLSMFFNIIKNDKYYKKLIVCGTGGEYDRRFDVRQVKEEDFGKSIPIDDYSFSKYVISKYIEAYKGNAVVLRLFAVFGKYEDFELRFISNAICKNLLKLSTNINQNVYFDYIYVNDVIKIFEYFIENDNHEKFYNIGTGESIDLITIDNKINSISKNNNEIVIRNPGLNKEFSCNNSKLMNLIPNFKFTPIDIAIKEMYDFYIENIDKLDLKNIIDDKFNKTNYFKDLKN